jgi:hypothetical protein
MKHACMMRPSTFIRMREFFPMSIASVDGKQHLSEVVFRAQDIRMYLKYIGINKRLRVD